MPRPVGRRYWWDEDVGRYRGFNGRFVASSTVRRALDRTLDAAVSPQGRVSVLSNALQSGEISLADWQTGMMKEVKNVHINSATAARGGYANMNQAEWGRVGQRIRFHYDRLDYFARQIQAGEVVLDGRFLTRSNMYIQAGRSTYERTADAEQRQYGFTEIRNILRDRVKACESGIRVGCINLTEMGWMSLDDPRWAAPGERTCLGSCRCETEYRNPATGETR